MASSTRWIYDRSVFGFQVPKSCPDIPDGVMDPASSWPSSEAYMKRYLGLASRFIDNFKKFQDVSGLSNVQIDIETITKAGPHI
jgi:phosphoenolpyruvate carboxykinase (ATP)